MGLLAFFFLALNSVSILKLTGCFSHKRYYVPIFVVSIAQVAAVHENCIVLFESVVVSYYLLVNLLQITLLIFTFVMVVKFKILGDAMSKRKTSM